MSRKQLLHIGLFVLICLIPFSFVCTKNAEGTSIKTVELETLFKEADVVAFVRVLAGDAENFDVAIYKAEVLSPFKGCTNKQVVYFGPFVKYEIGGEYLVFL